MSDGILPAVHAAAPGDTAPGLQIRLFGPLEVRIGPHLLLRLRTRKGLWLLALLALRGGREVERSWLAATLWPDVGEADARRSLRQRLHDLRLALGPEAWRLAGEAPRMLRLDLCGAFVDVLSFDATIARGDLDSLAAAVQLYRGPLLEECAEEWVLAERQRREQAFVLALERLAASATARGEHAAAASYLRQAVSADPFRDELQRALMEAHAEGGNPADALLVYREYRARLWREMAAEPAEETTALFRRLRDETRARARPPRSVAPSPHHRLPPSPSSPVPCRLPLPLTPLIGREEAVEDIIGRLAAGRLVTLTGIGGIGKTRLALQVAEKLADEFEAGAAFVDLAPLADSGTVPEAVRAALGVPLGAARQEPTEALRHYLAARRLLLVLDNCEHLLGACAALADALLGQCQGLRILAASRQALGLPGETVWRVPSLALPGTQQLTPDSLLQYAAVRLFVERARAVGASFGLTPRQALAVAQVCRRLDGIPLALELAAARMKALSVEQLNERLDDRFRLLTGGSRAALPRQLTLRATLDWSYDLLSEPERVLMRRLSVFAEGWTLEAAEAVCSGVRDERVPSDLNAQDQRQQQASVPPERLNADEVLDLLTSLVEKSLVLYEEQGGEGRYRLLETVRQYFSERLLQSGEGEATRGRHLDYYLAMAEEAEPQLMGAQQGEWLERLETEHDNLRAALMFARSDHSDFGLPTDQDPIRNPKSKIQNEEQSAIKEMGLRLAGALWRFWSVRGYLTEGREQLAQALARAPAATASRAKALETAGSLAYRQADYRSARSLQEESLAIRRAIGDRRGLAASLRNLGLVSLHQGDYGAAHSLHEESLAINRELGNRWGIAVSLRDLGSVAHTEGEYVAARSLYEESLAILRELGDRVGIANSLRNMGSIAFLQGKYETARSLFEESLAIRRELGDRPGIAGSLHDLGSVAHVQGDNGAAHSFFQECLAIRRELGNRPSIACSLWDLGSVAYLQGEYGAALSCFEECLAIRRDLGDHLGIAASLEALAALACEGQGQPGEGKVAGGGFPEEGISDRDGAGRRAVRLLGAGEALREAIAAPVPPGDREAYCRAVSRAREVLGAEAFAAAWTEGREMPLDEAIADALRGAGESEERPQLTR
jgi:predicted ATPase/DNA-binding SARP family transcriptional activator